MDENIKCTPKYVQLCYINTKYKKKLNVFYLLKIKIFRINEALKYLFKGISSLGRELKAILM